MYLENGVIDSDKQISSWEIVCVVLKKDFNLEIGLAMILCLSGGINFGHVFLWRLGVKVFDLFSKRKGVKYHFQMIRFAYLVSLMFPSWSF